jgi:hypothetical protein
MDPVVAGFHQEIERTCERILGRPVAEHERRFFTGRQGLIALESIHDFVKGMDAAELERYLASERPTGPLPEPAERRPGRYLGTIVDGRWWKRYRREGFFARGNGEWWLEGRTLCFRRALTTAPIRIDLDALVSTGSGAWHAGHWGGGRTVITLTWEREGRPLTAGFVLSDDAGEALALLAHFRPRPR